MKYVVFTENAGTFELTLGQIAINEGNIACRDANGTAHAAKGANVIAMMRSDFADSYKSALEELEQLKNRNGH